jgi:hypothetical protein
MCQGFSAFGIRKGRLLYRMHPVAERLEYDLMNLFPSFLFGYSYHLLNVIKTGWHFTEDQMQHQIP